MVTDIELFFHKKNKLPKISAVSKIFGLPYILHTILSVHSLISYVFW